MYFHDFRGLFKWWYSYSIYFFSCSLNWIPLFFISNFTAMPFNISAVFPSKTWHPRLSRTAVTFYFANHRSILIKYSIFFRTILSIFEFCHFYASTISLQSIIAIPKHPHPVQNSIPGADAIHDQTSASSSLSKHIRLLQQLERMWYRIAFLPLY